MIHATIKNRPKEDISILLQFDNHSWNYLCECGTASDLTMKECQNIKAIFISHTHIDHFVNFDTILRYQIGTQNEVVICGPENIAQHVQAKILAYTWNLIEKEAISYEVREILSANQIKRYRLQPPQWELEYLDDITTPSLFSNALFEVDFTILDHGIPSIAYLFKEKDKVNIDLSKSNFKGGAWIRELKTAFINQSVSQIFEIEGKKYLASELFPLLQKTRGYRLGVIMDHAASPENHQKIKTLFQNCDKVFIEAFYKATDKDLAMQNKHSYSSKSAEIMRLAKVKTAIPVHFSRRYEEEDLAILLKEFEEARMEESLKV